MRWQLTQTVTLPGPAGPAVAAFRAAPDAWLPAPLTQVASGHWQLYVWGAGIGVLVDCTVGPPLGAGEVTTRPLAWEPLGRDSGGVARMVPSFDGSIAISAASDDGAQPTQLTLTGFYEPPGGVVGGLADRAGLRHVAAATSRAFLTQVAQRLRAAVLAG